MSFLEQIKKPVPQAPVITIVGFAGSGKSSLAGLFPNPIFIQAENATSVFETMDESSQPSFFPQLQTANAKRSIKTSDILFEQLRELLTQPHEFKTVVIDTITALNTMFESEVVEFDNNPNTTNIGDSVGGFSKGYIVVASMHTKLRAACEHLRKKGMTVVFLSHTGIVKMKNRPESGEYVAYSLEMHEKSRQVYVSSSDVVAYLKARDFVVGNEENKRGQTTKFGRVTNTGERVLITSSDGTIGYIDAKNRYNLPDEIEVNKGENPLLSLIPYFKNQATQQPTQPTV